jgi:thiol-disulfide isomerase/thioredoxin
MPSTPSRRRPKWAAIALAAFAGFAVIVPLRAADDAKPAATQRAAPTTQRSQEVIGVELQKVSHELQEILKTRKVFTDEKLRSEAAPKAIPLMKRYVALFDELAAQDPLAKAQVGRIHGQFYSMMTTLGDEDAKKQLQAIAVGDGPDAIEAKSGLLMSRWIHAGKDADTQKKLAEELKALVKANPTNDSVAMTAVEMLNTAPANKDVEDAVQKIITEDAKGPQAAQMAQVLESQKKLKALENKPLTIAGTTVDGKPFSTADWKGKVVLVDFWATWCQPCREALPDVKRAYATYHDKGLEIVGVSSDQSAGKLTGFLKDNPDMPWPQLFDPKAEDWHPLTKQLGVEMLPTMFLIDKKGILRNATAQETFEDDVPRLLGEKEG